MHTIKLQLPTSFHKQLNELARREGMSIDQLAASTLSEKIAALLSPVHLDQRAKRASHEQFNAVLAKVKDVEPVDRDKL